MRILNTPLRGNIYKKLRDQKGATTVEFAFVAILFVLLFLGIIDFGLLLYNQQVITNAGREGARYGIVARPEDYKISDADIEAKVNNFASSHLVYRGTGDFFVDAKFKNVLGLNYCEKFKDELTVYVKYEYSFFFLPIDLPALESNTVMVCE